MPRRVLLLAAALVMVPAPPEDAVKREWAKFAGTWRRVAHETEGRKTPADTARRFRLTLTADGTYAMRVDDLVVVEGTAGIDPTRKPKTVDMTPTTGRSKGQKLLGIYELEGDEYRICYAPSGKERPQKFAAEAGSGHVLVVYKREK